LDPKSSGVGLSLFGGPLNLTAAIDPHVWSGRALQEVFIDLSVWSCINASGLRLERFVLRAIMDISAPAFSLAARPQMGHLGHQGYESD
jgi:hypothetical protein